MRLIAKIGWSTLMSMVLAGGAAAAAPTSAHRAGPGAEVKSPAKPSSLSATLVEIDGARAAGGKVKAARFQAGATSTEEKVKGTRLKVEAEGRVKVDRVKKADGQRSILARGGHSPLEVVAAEPLAVKLHAPGSLPSRVAKGEGASFVAADGSGKVNTTAR